MTGPRSRPLHAKPAPDEDLGEGTITRAAGHLHKLAGVLAQVFRSPATSLAVTVNGDGYATITVTTTKPWSTSTAYDAVRHLEGALKAAGLTVTRPAAPRRATNAAGFARIEVAVVPDDALPARKNDIVMAPDAANIAANRRRLSRPTIIGAFIFPSLTLAAEHLGTSGSALGEKIRLGTEGYRWATADEISHALADDAPVLAPPAPVAVEADDHTVVELEPHIEPREAAHEPREAAHESRA
jgi:hypothetical protein